MSNKPINMFKIREVLRLYGEGRGSKYIAKVTGVARNTVKKYLLTFVRSGLLISEAHQLNDTQLARVVCVEKPVTLPNQQRFEQLQALLPELSQQLRKRGMTKGKVYEQYIRQCPDGYKPSQFLDLLNKHIGLVKPSVRIAHQAGDKLFIDFAGKKLQLVDPVTGEVTAVEVFVSILGCSQLTFVMAVASQQKEDFIKACEQALHFYGGVPQGHCPR